MRLEQIVTASTAELQRVKDLIEAELTSCTCTSEWEQDRDRIKVELEARQARNEESKKARTHDDNKPLRDVNEENTSVGICQISAGYYGIPWG
jgi:O-acetyl-ADP-ribose deacetylase (regulator of RNase III)